VPAHHHNNIFWVQDETRYVWGGSKNHRFENNLSYGTHADGPEDARAVRADPTRRCRGKRVGRLSALP